MAFALYLAMTAGEIAAADRLPDRLCYMACHFSAYTTGLSNIPKTLPKGSVLILNDRMSIQGHDPQAVARQLKAAAEELEAEAVLLDFQRPVSEEATAIIGSVIDTLSCPVAVCEGYAKDLPCPVFLPPPPVNCPLKTHIAPWQGRELWLEIALDVQAITVTKNGSCSRSLFPWDAPDQGHVDSALHCHYKADVSDEEAVFTLWRTEEDLRELLTEAADLGICRCVGLYQELKEALC